MLFIPESPRWLFQSEGKKSKQAIKNLKYLNELYGGTFTSDLLYIDVALTASTLVLYASSISNGVFLLDSVNKYEIDPFYCGSSFCDVSNYIMTTNTVTTDTNVPPTNAGDISGVLDAVASLYQF
jgi:hypothetical protein